MRKAQCVNGRPVYRVGGDVVFIEANETFKISEWLWCKVTEVICGVNENPSTLQKSLNVHEQIVRVSYKGTDGEDRTAVVLESDIDPGMSV